MKKEKSRDEIHQLADQVVKQLEGLRLCEAIDVIDLAKFKFSRHAIIDLERCPFE